MTRISVKAVLGMALLLAAGCSGGGGGTATSTGIGPAGGVVLGPGGSQVVVPAGALTTTVNVQIAEDDAGAPAFADTGAVAAGVTFAITPHGTTFAAPVTVTLPFDASKVPAGGTPQLYQAEPGGAFAPIPTTVQGATLSAQVSSLSWFMPGTPPLPSALQASDLAGHCLRQALTGQVWCWGEQLDLAYGSGLAAGTGNYEYVFPEATHLPPRSFGEVVGGHDYVCGISSGFEVWCIGDRTITRASGLDPVPDRTWVKILLPTGVDLYRLSAGGALVCGIGSPTSQDRSAVGKVFCWGNNLRDALGRGGGDPNGVAPVASSAVYAYVAAGGLSACASQDLAGTQIAGTVDCWGSNIYSEISTSQALGSSNVPIARGVVVSVRPGALSMRGSTGCGIQADGTALCWGDNFEGQRGDGTAGTGVSGQDFYAPSPVAGGHKWKSITPSDNTTCGLDDGGTAFCWGYAAGGSIGDGQDTTPSGKQVTPAQVSTQVPFVELGSSLCGRTQDGEVYCWGSNRWYDLGLDQLTPEFSNVPVRIKDTALSRAMP